MLPFSGNIWITSNPESAAEVKKERDRQTDVPTLASDPARNS